MAVKYAVLGLLLERRGYGYDLINRLEGRLGPAWQLNPSTVYAALDQLEDDGLIAGRTPDDEEPGPRFRRGARRLVYEATAEGTLAFEEWISEASWQPEPIRGGLLLKLATARLADAPALLAAIDHAELIVRALHEECRENATAETGEHPGFLARLVSEASALRLEAEMRWLEMARRHIQKAPSAGKGERALPFTPDPA